MSGMVLSIYNNLKIHHKTHVYTNLLLIFIWGSIPILITVGITTPNLFSSIFIGDILLILVAIFFLFRLEGIAGVIHVIEKFSNILSFARLMAIGLVGAWMGLIANNLISHPFSIFGITLFGILLGLSLHIINIFILILSPSIHAMRLNVYEFFSQFVVGGGNIYKPFGSI
jgi:vacuolar-type H+-ATPase subunit I/STV1